MRVLHVDSERNWRGGQTQLAFLLEEPEQYLCAPRDEADVDYGWRSLCSALQSIRPDILTAHSARAHQLILGASGQLPLVVHRRVDFAIRRVSRWKYRAVDAVVAVSWAVRDVVVESGIHPHRVFVVKDGVRNFQPSKAQPRALGKPVVLAVGALVPHKGHRHLIEACREGGFQLWLVGEGELRSELEALAEGADVHFLGQKNNVSQLMRTADVFCHPSVEEGFGQAILEARLAGCRMVVSRAGGAVEAAGPEAWLVPPGNSKALAEGICRQLQHSKPTHAFPEALFARQMVRRTLEVYETVRERGTMRPTTLG